VQSLRLVVQFEVLAQAACLALGAGLGDEHDPVLWLVFTLVRGEFVGFYPYPFVDVGEHRYPTVLLNRLLVAVLFLGLASAVAFLDSRLGSPTTAIR